MGQNGAIYWNDLKVARDICRSLSCSILPCSRLVLSTGGDEEGVDGGEVDVVDLTGEELVVEPLHEAGHGKLGGRVGHHVGSPQ